MNISIGILIAGLSIYLFSSNPNQPDQALKEPGLKTHNNFNKVDSIEILLSEKQIKTIDSLKEDVLKNKRVKASHKFYMKTKMVFNKDTFKVKIRLKGDKIDHFTDKIPSFRVKVLGKRSILDSKKFSLQALHARNLIMEWYFLKLLKSQNIMALNSSVVILKVGDQYKVTNFEGHFTKELTKRFDRPKGPIVCVSEEALWNNKKLNDTVQFENELQTYLQSPIKVFKSYKKLDESIVSKATNLLDDFRKGRKTASEVFDIEKLAIHTAITDLTNSHHGLRWHNRRYYYNSKTEKLEPIGFDGCGWRATDAFTPDAKILSDYEWASIFKDPAFIRSYLFHLNRISQPSFLEGFFEEYDQEIKAFVKKVKLKNKKYNGSHNRLNKNAAWIQNNYAQYKERLLKENSSK